jgi:CheY-like chemotaxis protein
MTKNNSVRPRVLLVDDYPDAREMYSEYLQFSGFDVVEAANGMEALQRAVDEAPDIILMDLSLPVMDGWEATRRLKADPRTAEIPVVALTGHALAGISEGAKQAGCDAFVTKPCLPEDLVREIRRVLESAIPDPPERQVCENLKLAPALRIRRRTPVMKAVTKARKSASKPAKKALLLRPVPGRRKAMAPRPATTNPKAARRLERTAASGPRAVAAVPSKAAAAALLEAESQVAGSRGKYVYCVIEASDQLRFGSIGHRRRSE